MTRVTVEDGLVFIITSLDGFSTGQNITKVEKQVKDLTIEECEQLGIYVNYYGQICKMDGIEWEFGLPEEKIININKDDYIDITSLVVGE